MKIAKVFRLIHLDVHRTLREHILKIFGNIESKVRTVYSKYLDKIMELQIRKRDYEESVGAVISYAPSEFMVLNSQVWKTQMQN